jgi:hypothetical protein
MSYLAHRRKYFQIPGCVAYYKLDGTTGPVIDSVAGNNGTNVGAIRGVTGKIGDAFSFDGVNDYITVPNSTENENLAQGDFTVSAWIKHSTNTPSSPERILSKRALIASGSTEGWIFYIDTSGNVGINCVNSSTNAITASTTSVLDDAWHLAVGVYTQSTRTYKIYIDGVDESTSIISGGADPASDSSNTLNIGANSTLSDGYFDGTIDEVGLLDTALTAAQVLELYNSGDGKTYPY